MKNKQATTDHLTISLTLKKEDAYNNCISDIKALHTALAAKGKYKSGQNIKQTIETFEISYKKFCLLVMTKTLTFSKDEGFELSDTLPIGVACINNFQNMVINNITNIQYFKDLKVFNDEITKSQIKMHEYLEVCKSEAELGTVDDVKIYNPNEKPRVDEIATQVNNININQMIGSQIQQGSESSTQSYKDIQKEETHKQSLWKKIWTYLPGIAGIGSFFINFIKFAK